MRFNCKLIALLVGIFGEILWLGALAILVVKLDTLLPLLPRLLSWPPSSLWQGLLCMLLGGFLVLGYFLLLISILIGKIGGIIDHIIKLPLMPLRLTFSYIRDPHKWEDDWKYERPNSCTQVQLCRRCGSKQQREFHDWDDVWKYENANSCIQVQLCHRCGFKQQRVSHDWDLGDRQLWPCETVATCRRCGETAIEHHSFSWEYVLGGDIDHEGFTCICSRCDRIDATTRPIPWNLKGPEN